MRDDSDFIINVQLATCIIIEFYVATFVHFPENIYIAL